MLRRTWIAGLLLSAVAAATSMAPPTAAEPQMSAASAPAASVVTAAATKVTARTLLGRLTVKAESHSSTYERAKFKHWVDADGDSCNTREEVLIAESTVKVKLGAGCKVLSGKWLSYYDKKTWTSPSDVDIDHVIALKEGWESGAWAWSAAKRQRFANDLGLATSLLAVTDNVNASKGDRDPAQWLPPAKSAYCGYATGWVKVKYRWRLSINAAERTALRNIITGDCGATLVTVPARAS